MVNARISHEPPIGIIFNPAEGDIGSRRHVGDVQPHRDMGEGGALNLVQCAGVPKAEREMRDAVFRRPGMHGQADALIGANDDIAAVHAQHSGAHSVDEADGLVEVLSEDHARADVDGHLHGLLGHHLAACVVLDVALRVAGHDRQGDRVGEEGRHGEVVQLRAGPTADGQEERVGGLL